MKVTMNVECSPEEARRFFGLPDIAPMQEAVLQEMQQQLLTNIRAMDAETIMKNWLPVGLQGMEHWQKMFWQPLNSAMGSFAEPRKK